MVTYVANRNKSTGQSKEIKQVMTYTVGLDHIIDECVGVVCKEIEEVRIALWLNATLLEILRIFQISL
jgi:hypothetical protein